MGFSIRHLSAKRVRRNVSELNKFFGAGRVPVGYPAEMKVINLRHSKLIPITVLDNKSSYLPDQTAFSIMMMTAFNFLPSAKFSKMF